MHNINYIRDNPIEFDNGIKLRGEDPISSKILEIDKIKRNSKQKETQSIAQGKLQNYISSLCH